jgi:hypothetical protein
MRSSSSPRFPRARQFRAQSSNAARQAQKKDRFGARVNWDSTQFPRRVICVRKKWIILKLMWLRSFFLIHIEHTSENTPDTAAFFPERVRASVLFLLHAKTVAIKKSLWTFHWGQNFRMFFTLICTGPSAEYRISQHAHTLLLSTHSHSTAS